MTHYVAEINIKQIDSDDRGTFQTDRRLFSEQLVVSDKRDFINQLAAKCGELTGKLVLV